jgi:hypothetical protein
MEFLPKGSQWTIGNGRQVWTAGAVTSDGKSQYLKAEPSATGRQPGNREVTPELRAKLKPAS